MNRNARIGAFALTAIAAASAQADVTITQGDSAPTYPSLLTFDEVGGPVGAVVGDEWSPMGISQLVSGDGSQFVGNLHSNPGFGWLPDNNLLYAPWGAFLTFDGDVDAFSVRYWDSSGPATFSGGGAAVVALNDGIEVAFFFVDNPAYAGVGDEYFNIVADNGSVFDEVRMLGFGFFPEAFVDDISWNPAPAPASGALLALGGLVATRRRRA
ncbi:MAG: hypothetical protein H6811_08745 [Phycisphaeraceae bacterium]|nr:hypothetical protein [Phycisphaeraceae bacterium]